MEFYAKKIGVNFKDLKKIRKLYIQSFPKSERMPFPLLLLVSKRKGADFYAFYSQGELCGFTCLMRYQNMAFVLYLAIESRLRSRGYGSEILSWIKKRHPGAQIALSIETVRGTFEKDPQRRRRKCFYLKNGFLDTGYTIREFGEVYDILSTQLPFPMDQYQALIQKFSFGSVKTEILKSR